MYLTNLLTLWVEVLSDLFDEEFKDPDFRGLHISPEYPVLQTEYPGIWVDYSPTSDVRQTGIGHIEYSEPGEDGERRRLQRWSFQGVIQLTFVTLNNLERARLIDAFTHAFAFGLENPAESELRNKLENNDLIPLMVQWDQFNIGGKGEAPGTPWGTDDVVYEMTCSITVEGTFLSRGSEATLIPLSAIEIWDARIEGEPARAPDTGGWI